MAKTCLIDGFGPLPLAEPANIAEVCDLVRAAASRNEAIYPVGGGTMVDYGFPPTKPGIAVQTRQLNAVVDYPARDMTITVQAGMTLAQLQTLLAQENQRLPIDVPLPERATVGGALAVNASGPRRYGFGTLRDYVIGISVVNDRGEEIKAGGRVVKNVAGYDLCKLYIGSLGTLGAVTQVTFKVRPKPEKRALVAIECPGDFLESLLTRLQESKTRPVCIDLLNQQAVCCINQDGKTLPFEPAWLAIVAFEDNAAAVDWQAKQLRAELSDTGAAVIAMLLDDETESLWQTLSDLPVRSEASLVFKANFLPHACTDFCREAAGFGHLLLQAHAGNGIVIGQVKGALTLQEAQSMLDALRTAAVKAEGNLVVVRCPTAWKNALPIWGAPRGDLGLMREVKRKLDPQNTFNPGRFLEGL